MTPRHVDDRRTSEIDRVASWPARGLFQQLSPDKKTAFVGAPKGEGLAISSLDPSDEFSE